MVKLRHSPGITGGFSYDGEHYPVDDGVLDVADDDVAREMVAECRKITWLDGPPDDAVESQDEICGTEMSDGTLCERPADECPYHE